MTKRDGLVFEMDWPQGPSTCLPDRIPPPLRETSFQAVSPKSTPERVPTRGTFVCLLVGILLMPTATKS